MSILIDPYSSLSDKYDELIEQGLVSPAEAADGLAQWDLLGAALPSLETSDPGKFVAYADGKQHIGDTPTEVEAAAMTESPGRQFVVAAIPPATFGVPLEKG